jgi:hypothetical protein
LKSKPTSTCLKPTVLIVNLTLKSRKMENHLYICQYCSKVQTNRRQKQKYCSNSCRTSFTIRKFKGLNKPALENKNIEEKKNPGYYMGKVECSCRNFSCKYCLNLFTRDENKPATKKDIKEIKQLFITQHHHKNMPDRYDGARPFTICKRKSCLSN